MEGTDAPNRSVEAPRAAAASVDTTIRTLFSAPRREVSASPRRGVEPPNHRLFLSVPGNDL